VPGADGELADAQWAQTFLVNVTGNYLLARHTERIFKDQGLPATMVLTSSANAVVPKKGSEAYDTGKAALNHLIRELSIKLGPTVRVNGIAPATVVAGSTMFPRDRVIQSLQKYKIEFSEAESTEELRAKLADFYAQRTLTKRPILPQDCAAAIVWLGANMQRVCFVLQVKPERLEEYKERHRSVWPDMQAALRETGWGNYSLFLRDDGLLVGYLETEDFERARAGMASREVNERWQREMGDFFVQPDGVLPDRAMQPLQEVFHL
jgi:L-rhamnose mutarotase